VIERLPRKLLFGIVVDVLHNGIMGWELDCIGGVSMRLVIERSLLEYLARIDRNCMPAVKLELVCLVHAGE
jgi:hypothetical protein